MKNKIADEYENLIFGIASSVMGSFAKWDFEEREICLEIGDFQLMFTKEKNGADWDWEWIDLSTKLKLKKTEIKKISRRILKHSEEVCVDHTSFPWNSVSLMRSKTGNYFLWDGGGMSAESISFITEKDVTRFKDKYDSIEWDFDKLLKENS